MLVATSLPAGDLAFSGRDSVELRFPRGGELVGAAQPSGSCWRQGTFCEAQGGALGVSASRSETVEQCPVWPRDSVHRAAHRLSGFGADVRVLAKIFVRDRSRRVGAKVLMAWEIAGGR
jgi:hypothetical protein